MLIVATVAIAVAGLAVVAAALTEPPLVEPVPVPDSPVTPAELRNPGFAVTRRGYDMAAVDALLVRAARTLEDVMSPPGDTPSSGEELEDGSGDGAGGLDD